MARTLAQVTTLACFICAAHAAAAVPPGVYYIDPAHGCDSASGTSPETAWRGFGPIHGKELRPGTEILLRAGAVFEGPLELRGKGTESEPITLGCYGEGPLPQITVTGPIGNTPAVSMTRAATVLVTDPSHWRIQDLAIQHPRETRGLVCGLHLYLGEPGPHRNLVMRGLHVHNIAGALERGGAPAAVKVECAKGAWAEGVRVEDCYIHGAGFYGVCVDGWRNRNRSKGEYLPSTGVIIRNNLLHDILGDGIVPLVCDKPLIEHNEVHRFALNQTMGGSCHAGGIWPYGCNDSVIRLNRVMGGRGVLDGEAFDVDNDNKGALIERNYTQNNGGGFLLLCTKPQPDEPRLTGGVVVRHNVSINDGYQPYGRNNVNVGAVNGARIVNNIFAFTYPGEVLFTDCWDYGEGLWARNVAFESNIIYAPRTTLSIDWGQAQNITFTGNILWGEFGDSWRKAAAAAHAVAPGFKDMMRGDFRLAADSPAYALGFEPFCLRDAGLTLESSWLRERDRSLLRNPREWSVPIPPGYFVSD